MYRLLRLFSKVRARSRRCSSFPNRTRCRWAPVWFLGNATSPVSPLAPRRSKLCIACSDFFQKSERAYAAAPPFQTGPAVAGLRFGFWRTPQVLYRHSDHVGASFVSLAPIFYKNQSALAPLLLLSKPDPLPLGSGLVFLLYCKVRFAPAYFFACGFKISRTPALLFYLFRRKSRFVGTSCARSNSLA